jgi:prevent-host-death family protein
VDEFVSAADANRNFSAILREVKNGRSYVVTSHGRVVARIVPAAEERTATFGQSELFKRLAEQPAVNGGKWTREELYERDDE